MGLKICKTIQVFCAENDVAIESARRHKEINPTFEGQIVDMRVGVHSGRVIYGIVGSKRYKFDVYSQGNIARPFIRGGCIFACLTEKIYFQICGTK